MSSPVQVSTGIWTDWSLGQVQGLTVTLRSQDAALLTAFIAIYIQIASSGSWKIVQFIIHQIRASKQNDDEDALFHQQQIILRNSSSPLSALTDLLSMAWAWRRFAASFKRSIVLVLLASVHFAAFAIASLYSSRISSLSSQHMLVESSNCGTWSFSGDFQDEDVQSRIINETITAAAYARGCYSSNRTDGQCGGYVNSRLPWTAYSNAACPFPTGRCRGDTGAYSMDTGPLESFRALGINSKPSDRVTYRKVTTCSPIHVDSFEKLEQTSSPNGTLPVDRLYLGPSAFGLLEYTYQYAVESVRDGIGYGLNTFLSNPLVKGAWQPVDDLDRADADTSIFFLNQNSIRYNTPVFDPMFETGPVEDAAGGDQNVGYYYTTVLSCIDQHQFCSPSIQGSQGSQGAAKTCTPLTNYVDAISNLSTLSLTEKQAAASSRITRVLKYLDMHYAVYGRGASALRANELVRHGDQALGGATLITSPSLPANHWQTEVDLWFGVTMARLQQAVIDYATGPSDLGSDGTVIPPTPGADQALCHEQRVPKKSGYQNFSILAILIVVFACTLLIALGFAVPALCARFQKARNEGSRPRLAWILDYTLQLHRMAQEGRGWGDGIWKSCGGSVPILPERPLGKYVLCPHEQIEPAPDVSDTDLWYRTS
ncbi:hypothetical protein D6C98_02783 [Aureobasidium pullulans]|nr:hypothetical protein D6D08_07129 [Aureobasidium pullulans]THY08384.1 hypothetical protein D6D03_01119 [Aureobasidium pullulans]THY59248.1 hypothetical protein D6C98_02783 [Aureobasidium pullulans]THZ28616.1 hypothetical protein D6C89_02496 [Aureobasidium pullulans]